jgi:hypothetical protein
VNRPYLKILIACTSFLLLSFAPASEPGSKNINTTLRHSTNNKRTSKVLYDSLKLHELGLSEKAFEYAYKGYELLENKGTLKNPGILTICDFTKSSSEKRMYIIDVANYKTLMNTYVAHGKNSGGEYARKFSNKPKSLSSSLGFFITQNIYVGKHGLSLKLEGLEAGFNDNAGKRAVVIHGASYIGENCQHSQLMGRSYGCPAVPKMEAPKIIDLIKDGTCLFIYHPSASYLHGSKILNG